MKYFLIYPVLERRKRFHDIYKKIRNNPRMLGFVIETWDKIIYSFEYYQYANKKIIML